MKIKAFLQKYMPYSIYVMFVWIVIKGFPTIYIYRTGEYISNSLIAPIYFIFCTAVLTYFAKNPVARKFKWLPSAVSLVLIESYFFLLFAQYYFILSVLILVAVVTVAVLIYWRMCKRRPIGKRSCEFLKQCKKRTTVICAYLTVIILLIPTGVGLYKEYVDVFSVKDWNDLVAKLEAVEAARPTYEQGEQDSLIVSLSNWDNLNIDERFEVLCEVGVREEKNLGIENYAEIRISNGKIDTYTLAYYYDSEKLIKINVDQLNSGTAEEAVNTIIHEVFHAYQHYVVDSLDFDSDFVKNSYYYADARKWKFNMNHYNSGTSDFSLYENQPLEADARAYAEQRTSAYF